MISEIKVQLIISLLLFAGGSCTLSIDEADSSVFKRDLFSLSTIIREYTRRSAWDYNKYGCYCGLGGSGTPVDDVDRCCQTHDRCYSTSCSFPHFTRYSVECRNGSCRCKDNQSSCKFKVCSCDVQFGECLSRARYNPANKGRC